MAKIRRRRKKRKRCVTLCNFWFAFFKKFRLIWLIGIAFGLCEKILCRRWVRAKREELREYIGPSHFMYIAILLNYSLLRVFLRRV